MKLWRGVVVILIIAIIIIASCYFFDNNDQEDNGTNSNHEDGNDNKNAQDEFTVENYPRVDGSTSAHPLYCVIRTDLQINSTAYKLWTWLDSPTGQAVIKESGYGPII